MTTERSMKTELLPNFDWEPEARVDQPKAKGK